MWAIVFLLLMLAFPSPMRFGGLCLLKKTENKSTS
uniref:Uncharacterized protein n=1 Tax=Arundo donax TaxID=35708 RepID=A0A0A9T815_ARUDO